MTTRRTITLRNNFHNTEAKAIALDGVISDRAMKRVERKLCGVPNCPCGAVCGPQEVKLVSTGIAEEQRIVETRKEGRQ